MDQTITFTAKMEIVHPRIWKFFVFVGFLSHAYFEIKIGKQIIKTPTVIDPFWFEIVKKNLLRCFRMSF